MPDSELPRNAQGRFYHLNCGPGDLAPYILTCGDPARARKISRYFDKVDVRRQNREFLTYTGSYKGIPLSVMATGIGPDNTAIAVIEAAQCVSTATFIRLGSCGALQPEVAPGDLVITSRALRDEMTTNHYAPPEYEARAHPLVLKALEEAAAELQAPYHVGLTCTTADFYGGQARQVPGFPIQEPEKVTRLRQAGVLNLEMEMSAYLTLAGISTYPLRAGGACAVLNNRVTGASVFASARLKSLAEKRLITVGLLAVEKLSAWDSEFGGGGQGACNPALPGEYYSEPS
ncbi:MAG: nucleoside phosphorylase [Deltaproteobacteria bacterium]|nr:nucleoside phosphorylase [Deltaproteobacteria bacterium]MBI4797120.1 nucleoside phosphorylase [Deltaproteobacteria bacterium]